jgi:hypothetical protein
VSHWHLPVAISTIGVLDVWLAVEKCSIKASGETIEIICLVIGRPQSESARRLVRKIALHFRRMTQGVALRGCGWRRPWGPSA